MTMEQRRSLLRVVVHFYEGASFSFDRASRNSTLIERKTQEKAMSMKMSSRNLALDTIKKMRDSVCVMTPLYQRSRSRRTTKWAHENPVAMIHQVIITQFW